MKLKAVSGMMLILLFIGLLTLAFNIQQVKSGHTTWTVDDDGPADFDTIQGAINAASPNDTIYVYNGTYYENVVINKTLTLMGESRSNTIINGSGLNYTGALVAIKADNVNMSGFTVINALLQGIEVQASQYCEVHDNIVCFTGDRGIVFGSAHNNKAYGNIVYNSSAYGGIEAIGGNNNTIYNNVVYFNRWGIATNHGSYNRIYNNTVHSNRGDGIHIEWPSTGNIIYNNNVSLNTYAGIMVMNEANGTVISGNILSGSERGIWLEDSLSNSISGNNITSNSNNGIGLSGSSNNSIVGNNITNNDYGIRLTASSSYNTVQGNNITGNNITGIYLAYSSNYNRISGNKITDNNYGVALFESSNNSFYYNNFVNNTYQVSTGEVILSPNIWDNGYPSGGNYWSDYTGVDVDGDGIGDTPYVIDPNNQDNYPLHAHVLRVPEDYSTPEEAKDAANPRETITIAPGIYNEPLVINKTLRILGIKGSDPIFEGGGSGVAVTLLSGASGSVVAGIVITNWDQGIFIKHSSDCKIYENIFEENNIAINTTESSTSNTIYANTISENQVGIYVSNSNDNIIYRNNFIGNTQQVSVSDSSGNVWDNGYPSGGNYWSDYTGVDVKSGPSQDQPGSDGIGDTPYTKWGIIDRYPLMNPWPCEITPRFPVRSVGGIYIPVNKLELLAPYIALAILLIVAVMTVGYVKKRKRHTRIISYQTIKEPVKCL